MLARKSLSWMSSRFYGGHFSLRTLRRWQVARTPKHQPLYPKPAAFMAHPLETKNEAKLEKAIERGWQNGVDKSELYEVLQ